MSRFNYKTFSLFSITLRIMYTHYSAIWASHYTLHTHIWDSAFSALHCYIYITFSVWASHNALCTHDVQCQKVNSFFYPPPQTWVWPFWRATDFWIPMFGNMQQPSEQHARGGVPTTLHTMKTPLKCTLVKEGYFNGDRNCWCVSNEIPLLCWWGEGLNPKNLFVTPRYISHIFHFLTAQTFTPPPPS